MQTSYKFSILPCQKVACTPGSYLLSSFEFPIYIADQPVSSSFKVFKSADDPVFAELFLLLHFLRNLNKAYLKQRGYLSSRV